MSITLDQVTTRYQSVPVVNDVSLKIEQGEFLVLLGPSGSGKSTLLRAIAGLTEIDHGRVSLHGRDVTGVSARDREVGFVFQHYALFRHMSVAGNIEFALQVRGVRAAERRARRKELLRLVALEGMDDRLPAQLSGGQQQRVAVARALAHRPEVLLMDEPFGALDAKIREELRRTIRQIQRELDMTTVLVTHDQEEAFALADRIGVMHQGRLLECGKPDDLYTRPATRFVSTFLGAANLLLGYRTARGVRFNSAPLASGDMPREVVAVLRPEEVELCAAESAVKSNFVGHGNVEEVLFGGAVERLRVRMASDGPVPVAPGRDGALDLGSLLEVSRTLPEQRDFPVAVGQRIAVGARSIHVLPTPISSFTAVAADAAAARELHGSPLLSTLGTRMQTRVATRIGHFERAPPGMPAIATGKGCAQAAEWHLTHGAVQLLCVPPAAPLPNHVVIHALDAESRRATLAVAASLLRHVAAEAIYIGIQPQDSPETDRGAHMRDLLDARSAALADHGLDMRTELRPGDVAEELQKELAAYDNSMLVLGTSDPAAIRWDWLKDLLENSPQRAVLIVNSARAEATPDG
jgi:sulfate transport system ATP-binding protein